MCVGMEGTVEQDTQCLQMFQKVRQAFLMGAHYGYHHPHVRRGDKFQYISMVHMVPVIIPISCQNQNCKNTHTHSHWNLVSHLWPKKWGSFRKAKQNPTVVNTFRRPKLSEHDCHCLIHSLMWVKDVGIYSILVQYNIFTYSLEISQITIKF